MSLINFRTNQKPAGTKLGALVLPTAGGGDGGSGGVLGPELFPVFFLLPVFFFFFLMQFDEYSVHFLCHCNHSNEIFLHIAQSTMPQWGVGGVGGCWLVVGWLVGGWAGPFVGFVGEVVGVMWTGVTASWICTRRLLPVSVTYVQKAIKMLLK